VSETNNYVCICMYVCILGFKDSKRGTSRTARGNVRPVTFRVFYRDDSGKCVLDYVKLGT